MKATHIFCASQAAITTMDPDNPSSSSSSKGGRAIDRYNPIIQDQKRLTKTVNPTHHNNKNKSKNPKSDKEQKRNKTIGFADENNEEEVITRNKNNNQVVRKQGWGCTRPSEFISPANSSRFLLPDKTLSDQFDPLLKQDSPPVKPSLLPPTQPEKTNKSDNEKSFKKSEGNLSSSPVKSPPRSSSSFSSRSSDQQVVVLRVSLHCRGCERKMRKHISKMEGVSSFTIDFMAKKVTVVGDITPLAVLTSVSKVKNAKLLTPTTIATPVGPQAHEMESNISEIKKQLGMVA